MASVDAGSGSPHDVDSGDLVFLDGSVRAHWTERGRESWRPARHGAEVMVELLPQVDNIDAKDEVQVSQLFFILGEEEADSNLAKTFRESRVIQSVSEQIGILSETDFVQLVQECLCCMADGARVELRPQLVAPLADDTVMRYTCLELHLKSLEPGKWDLAPAAKLALASRKRELGNRHLHRGRPSIALVRYRDALGLVEFDDNFEEEDEDIFPTDSQPSESPVEGDKVLLGCAWMRGPVRIEDVHAEREKCLANLAAASLQTSEFTGACKYCERALILNNDNVKVWFRKGQAEIALGNAAAAVKSFTEAVRLAPKDVEAARALRGARVALKSEQEHKRASERAFAMSSTDPVATNADGYTAFTAAEALWEGASKGERSDKGESRVIVPEEEKAAQVEYNRRQLMYHLERNKHLSEDKD